MRAFDADASELHSQVPAADESPCDEGAAWAGLSIDDWDCLLAAVTARLRLVVAEAPMHLHNGATRSLQASVLECADALDQLHVTRRKAPSAAQPTSVTAAQADRGAAAAQS